MANVRASKFNNRGKSGEEKKKYKYMACITTLYKVIKIRVIYEPVAREPILLSFFIVFLIVCIWLFTTTWLDHKSTLVSKSKHLSDV